MTTLFIKNMVCNRCVMVVESELKKMGFTPESVILGEAAVAEKLNKEDKNAVAEMLQPLGFELIDDKKSLLIEKLKSSIIDLVQTYHTIENKNLSEYLSDQLGVDYGYMSHLFSEIEGTTIEKFYIAQKIEKVKELLVYDELTLSQIAGLLNYSSVSHLSNQFKKVTGLTPTYFKSIKENKRKSLDQI